MHRPEVSDGAVHPVAESDPGCFKGFPNLKSFFLDLRYADAVTHREPGMIIHSVGPTGWVWTLKDQTAGTQLRVTAATMDELQLLAEALLADKRAPWVPDMWARQKRSSKRKWP